MEPIITSLSNKARHQKYYAIKECLPCKTYIRMFYISEEPNTVLSRHPVQRFQIQCYPE